MKITNVEPLLCDGGWWPWIFVKVETDEGLVGWGECSDNRVNPFGVVGCVEDLKSVLIGCDPRPVESLYWQMYRLARPNLGGVVQKAIAGIEDGSITVNGDVPEATEMPPVEATAAS